MKTNKIKLKNEPFTLIACILAFLLGVFPSMQSFLLPLYRMKKYALITLFQLIFIVLVLTPLYFGIQNYFKKKGLYKIKMMVVLTVIFIFIEFLCCLNFTINLKGHQDKAKPSTIAVTEP